MPAGSLVDPVTHAYLDAEALRAKFAQADAIGGKRVITYCGGGSPRAATRWLWRCPTWMTLRYDGSLVEWSARPELPLEVGNGIL